MQRSHHSTSFDREQEIQLLLERLRAAETELAMIPPHDPARRLAHERLRLFLGELEVASRRWASVRLAGDPPQDLRLDERLRRLARARLESVDQIERARRLMGEIRAGKVAPARLVAVMDETPSEATSA